MRRQHELVTVPHMGLQEVVQQRPLQERAVTPIDPEAAAAELRTSLVVDQAQSPSESHMVPGRETELWALAGFTNDLVVLLAPGQHVRVGEVRQRIEEGLTRLLQFDEPRLDGGQLPAHRRCFAVQTCRVLADPLPLRDLARDSLALPTKALDFGPHLPVVVVQAEKPIEVYLDRSLGQRLLDMGGILAN